MRPVVARTSRRRGHVAGAAAALLVALAVAGAAACKRDPKPGEPPPPPAELVPDAGLVAKDSAVAEAEPWKAALAAPDDAIELARLAEAEGASGLLVGLEEGGATGLVALAALPYADDAEHALPRLAEILVAVPPASLPPVIDCVEGIVQRPLTQTEPKNPLGAHAAFDALLAIAKRTDVPAPTRARAVSVGRLIAARGPYDAKLLPTEFDR